MGSEVKYLVLTTKAYFRECVRGERLTESNVCEACPAGQYILESDYIGACQTCSLNSNLQCFGGGLIGPPPGYWRFDGWTTRTIACLNSGSCLGPNISVANSKNVCKERRNDTFCYTGFCAEGYEGNLCSSCSEGYGKSTGNFCVPCSNNPLYYIGAVIVILVAIFVMVFTIRNALKVKETSKLNKPKSSILIKILLNYIQLVSIVGSFDFQWPDALKTMFDTQDKVASGPSLAFSVDCLLPSSYRPFFTKLLFVSASPLVLIIIGSIIWLIIFFVRKASFDRQKFKSNITTTFVVLLFMIHATLIQNLLFAFRYF